jgi:hypothetical protein
VRVLTSTLTLCLSERNYSRSIAQSNEEGTTERARCVASCSSNRPRRKKESDDRITDPLFQRKLLLRGKSEASKCFHFIHIFMRN